MKIDKNAIERVLKMNDEQLWRVIQYVAKKSGSDELSKMEKPSDMSKIRASLSSLTEGEIEKAVNLLKERKNERK